MRFYTIHEGETENTIIEWLKIEGYRLGIPIKYNLCDRVRIDRELNFINKSCNVIAIIDMDVVVNDTVKIARLEKNLLYLLKTSKSLLIITQNKNLEDELIRSLSLRNKKSLYQLFNSQGLKEYKSRLSQIHVSNLNNKLQNFNFSLFWNYKILNSIISNTKLTSVNYCLSHIYKFI